MKTLEKVLLINQIVIIEELLFHYYDYHYFKENYKTIVIDLSKQKALNADPRAIQQINFTDLDHD